MESLGMILFSCHMFRWLIKLVYGSVPILFCIFFEIIVNIRPLNFQLRCYKSTLDVLCDIYLYTRPTLKVPLPSSINFSSYSNFWTEKEIRLYCYWI